MNNLRLLWDSGIPSYCVDMVYTSYELFEVCATVFYSFYQRSLYNEK